MLQSKHMLQPNFGLVLTDSGTEASVGPYLMKVAENREELEGAIRLRSKVFADDFGARSARHDDPLWDFDELDLRAEHLIVVHRDSEQVVGTYRMILSDGPEGFYSQSEFDLSHFLARPGLKLELSRACVDANFRGGAIMMLLWKGLANTIRRTGASVLFGCSSLLTEDAADVRAILNALKAEGSIDDRYGITALKDYEMDLEPTPCLLAQLKDADRNPSELITPLLRMYLKSGAKLAGSPAHDRAFRCVDLLTILDVAQMAEPMARKYGLR
jgi:putative hemolysin